MDTELAQVLARLCQKYPEFDQLLQTYAALTVLQGDAPQQPDLSFVLSHPPGHYYSPLPNLAEVARVAPRVWGTPPEHLPGIDLNTRGQQRLFAKLTKHYKALPYQDGKTSTLRYHFDNDFFCYADAIILFCMLREFRPRRYIEVGSGYSSCIVLDSVELGQDIACTFIEPEPQRLYSLLRPDDLSRITIIEDFVQNIPMDVFLTLEENDFLFIDSSHVGKIGSDVLFELFEILPRLREGVIVHFHDVFYPFEYPRGWLETNHWAWNEDYFLRAFLQNNSVWDILFFNNYIGMTFPEMLRKWMPLYLKNIGGSLWLRKNAAA